VKRANEIYKNRKDAILVSVHSNAGLKPNTATGWCVFTSKGKTKSDHYAALLYNSACQYLKGWKIRTDYSDGDPDWESQFYILKNTHCPAVLTENLFMDNEKDCRFLLSPEGHEAIVALHVDAIITINDELNKI
jgi:N-acetylmuramoyl-L-alanine amidase